MMPFGAGNRLSYRRVRSGGRVPGLPSTSAPRMSIHQDTTQEATFVDRLADAFRDALLGMALVAPDGTFLRANAALCRLVGRTEDVLRRERIGKVVEDERVVAAIERA